jgi:adenine-specific DNA-methyltransferase
MKANTPIEERRLVLQADLDACKTQKDRNQLGQYATPTSLASDVLAYAKELLPSGTAVRFLDPAIGTGSFYSALLKHFSAKQIKHAQGVEIDPHYAKPARTLWKDSLLELKVGDFTEMHPPPKDERFNLIVCNPPYVRHHHLTLEQKSRLQTATLKASGVDIGGLSGLYCYFLGLAHSWLADDAIAGWLIPSEFMDVNYGKAIKRYLLTQVELIRVHRFDPSDLQFGDALVSSAVVWFRKRRPEKANKVEFSYGGTLVNPRVSRKIPSDTLSASAKWTGLASDGVRLINAGPKLSDFFSIKRGLATGDNGFFIMSRAQIKERGLPFKFFKPILPGPRHLPDDIIEAERDGTPKIERQLFMLDCRLPESEVKTKHPELWSYYQTGKKSVAETYLCRHRKPWYAQENRPAPLFLCTYMGRGLEKRAKPFRFILNRSQATAANVYLLLYPKPWLAEALGKNPKLADRIWEFLNAIPSATLLGEGRVYGGGLYKLEPRELANVPADFIAGLLGSEESHVGSQASLFATKAA